MDQALCYQLEYEEEIGREVHKEMRKDAVRKEAQQKKLIEVIELGTKDEEENINQGIEVNGEISFAEQVNQKIHSTQRNIDVLKKIKEKNKRKIEERKSNRNDKENENYPQEDGGEDGCSSWNIANR